MTTAKQQAIRELAIRELEKKSEKERNSLHEFLKTYWLNEKKEDLDDNRHIKEICNKLEKVYRGEIKRLIINIPPRSLKTEIVSKAFPVRCMGHKPVKIMGISYSTELAQKNSGGARDMYSSDTYLSIFPRRDKVKDDQNTKQHRETDNGSQYYASGSTGTITGIGADIIIIDDPLKPNDADSDTVRIGVNNNYHDTIKSRLNSKINGAIVIIMQRLHDDDLCGHLMELERQGLGEKWEKLIVPAIGQEDNKDYKVGDSFFEKRFPRKLLDVIKRENPRIFSTQYQQDPVNKESQEFHEEWFRYYTDIPKGRIFTCCDPAFSKRDTADNTSIITGIFSGMDLYILEYTVGKYDPAQLIDKLIYHYLKWGPEKIGIESFQAQTIIGFNLKAELQRKGHYVDIEEIRQTQDKEAKIRKLIPLYKNGHIYHKIGMDELEFELKRFPKGKHDDIIDSLQMLYSIYEIQPNAKPYKDNIEIKYDEYGRPLMVGISEDIYYYN